MTAISRTLSNVLTPNQKPAFKPVNSMYTPNLTYTYPGKLNLELIKPIRVGLPSLNDLFTVIQGVRCGEYMHYVQPLTSALSKGSGNCNPVYTQAGSITDRQLTTAPFYINLSWCEEEFAAVCTSLVEKYTAMGVDSYELQSNLQSIIFEEVIQAAAMDTLKVTFFGDNSLGSGSSNIYSLIDGVFTHFFDAETAYCVQPVSNTMPNQHNSVLAENQARDILRLLWGNSNIRLKQLPSNQKIFWVTGSFWENYYDSIINDCCNEGSWQAGQDGVGTLRYRGIELLPLWFADETLGAATNTDSNPFYDELRHFAVYTAKGNHFFGTERASDLNNLTSCFDCRTNETLIKGKMRFGYQFAECNLISWAK